MQEGQRVWVSSPSLWIGVTVAPLTNHRLVVRTAPGTLEDGVGDRSESDDQHLVTGPTCELALSRPTHERRSSIAPHDGALERVRLRHDDHRCDSTGHPRHHRVERHTLTVAPTIDVDVDVDLRLLSDLRRARDHLACETGCRNDRSIVESPRTALSILLPAMRRSVRVGS